MNSHNLIHTRIEGIDFTLFYDYDQLGDPKLSRLSEFGKVEWFRRRLELLFLSPLELLYDKDSVLHRESPGMILIIGFNSILSGMEGLGSYLPKSKRRKGRRGPNYLNFLAFLQMFMPEWDVQVDEVLSRDNPRRGLSDVLWDFRNGLAHGFVFMGGGLEYLGEDERWKVKDGLIRIDPVAFFGDFRKGVEVFFAAVVDNPDLRAIFLKRFHTLHPC